MTRFGDGLYAPEVVVDDRHGALGSDSPSVEAVAAAKRAATNAALSASQTDKETQFNVRNAASSASGISAAGRIGGNTKPDTISPLEPKLREEVAHGPRTNMTR